MSEVPGADRGARRSGTARQASGGRSRRCGQSPGIASGRWHCCPAARIGPARAAAQQGTSVQRAAVTSRRGSATILAGRDRATLERELLAAFRHDIPRVKVSPLYRLGIVFAASVMILLPLAYLGVIGLAASAMVYHATQHATLLSLGTGRMKIWAAIIYAAPLVAGAILVLFMLKPLFARSSDRGRTRSLTRQGEPLLFAFVDRLCQAVGARARRGSKLIANLMPPPESTRSSASAWC